MIYFLSWCWAGMIIGVSFIATPAKFLTSTSSLNQLLEVGKVTFGTFMYVEIVVMSLLTISIARARTVFLTYKVLLASVVFLLVFQYVYLLPKLDEHVDKLIQGLAVDSSNLHFLYVLAELSKMIILVILGMLAHKRTRQANTNAIS